jgi:hypothetical protein
MIGMMRRKLPGVEVRCFLQNIYLTTLVWNAAAIDFAAFAAMSAQLINERMCVRICVGSTGFCISALLLRLFLLASATSRKQKPKSKLGEVSLSSIEMGNNKRPTKFDKRSLNAPSLDQKLHLASAGEQSFGNSGSVPQDAIVQAARVRHTSKYMLKKGRSLCTVSNGNITTLPGEFDGYQMQRVPLSSPETPTLRPPALCSDALDAKKDYVLRLNPKPGATDTIYHHSQPNMYDTYTDMHANTILPQSLHTCHWMHATGCAILTI